ncbi:mCG148418 [Mus musculus]|jgi:hypothetical protein|nr:mCG148418 [Mus musculus]
MFFLASSSFLIEKNFFCCFFVCLLNRFQWNKISRLLGPSPFLSSKSSLSIISSLLQPALYKQARDGMDGVQRPSAHFMASCCYTQRCRLCPRSPNTGIGCFMDRVFNVKSPHVSYLFLAIETRMSLLEGIGGPEITEGSC